MLSSISFRVIGDSFIDLELTLSSNDNISNASDNEISDNLYQLELTYGQYHYLDDGLFFNWFASLDYTQYSSWSTFDHVVLNTGIELEKKIGMGAYVPVVGVDVSFSNKNYNVDIRDGIDTAIRVFWKKRLNERWDTSVALGFSQYHTKHNIEGDIQAPTTPMNTLSFDAFAVSQKHLSANTQVSLNEKNSISMGVEYSDGDITSTVMSSSWMPELVTARVPDTAIGEGYYAYRLDGKMLSLNLEWDYILSDEYTFRASYQSSNINSDLGSYEYKRKKISLTIIKYF